MRIGIDHRDAGTLDDCIANIKKAEADGFATIMVPHIFGFDALTLCALAGRETSRIEFATTVVPTFPRHPHALAQQALTTQAAAGGRLTLGIGISHQVVIETMLGIPYERLVRHMREYLEVLTALLRDGACEVDGELYRVHAQLAIPGVDPPRVLIGALRPQMVRLAGRLTDGTCTWMAGPTYIEQDIVTPMLAAAAEAGRPAPRTFAGVPVCVTDDVDQARDAINEQFAIYGNLPVYRAVLDAEGAAGPADIAIIGNEAEVEKGMRRLKDAGVTDLRPSITPVGSDTAASYARAYDLLRSLAPEL